MLDHVFADAIGAVRSALEQAMLERQAVEERFTTDTLLGDTLWETSYSIPGEGDPPRVQADVSLLWPTWSQTAYRRWILTGDLSAVPTIDAEVVIRAQGLDDPPDLAEMAAALPATSPEMGSDRFERVPGAALELRHDENFAPSTYAVEFSYAGSFSLRTEVLANGNLHDEIFKAAGGWISSTLITLSDQVA